jgi:hypothetical protein
MFSEVPLHFPPKELNKIEFTMIFWKHYAEVTSSLNGFMHKRLLFLKVWLQINNAFGTAIGCIGITIRFFALHLQFGVEKPSFDENLFHPFGLIWKSWVICRKKHVLHNSFPQSVDKPSISEFWLRSPRIEVSIFSTYLTVLFFSPYQYLIGLAE